MQMLSFGEAPAVRKYVYNVDNFNGIDLTSAPSAIEKTRSPDAPNMYPDYLGKPIKRNGYVLDRNYIGRINGRWEIGGHEVIHSGKSFFIDENRVWSGGNDEKSSAVIIGDNLYIFDGKEALKCDGTDIYPLSYDAYVPIVTIAKAPQGGGTAYEYVNMLSDKWEERFTVTEAGTTVFQLSFGELDNTLVIAKVMDEDGIMQYKVENVDFTVNRNTGTVTFLTGIGVTPVTGEDNVYITASRKFSDYKNRVNHSNICFAYNSAGTQNRIFLCGNDYKNRDIWCMADRPEYFPDLNYSVLGGGNTEITGYSIVDGLLATHIRPSDDGRSIIIRKYNLDTENKETFPIIDVLQGEEAVGMRTMVFMEKESLFLTKRGVYAITAGDIDGRMYTQNRSYFINKALYKEDFKKLEAAKWKQYYLLSNGEKVYILDTSQKSYKKYEPNSSFQYECYLWTDIPARIMWEKDGELYFGSNDGKVYRFAENTHSDLGKPIKAYWTMPEISGNYFFENKTIKMIGIEAAPFPQNKLRLEYNNNGVWETIKEWDKELCYFSWSEFSWSEFSWNGNSASKTVTVKTKIKKVDKASFRIVCDYNNKAFGLYSFAVQYAESGRYKR